MLSRFKWYRRLRGGRWGKVSGLFYDHQWIRVTDACVEDVDEDYRPKQLDVQRSPMTTSEYWRALFAFLLPRAVDSQVRHAVSDQRIVAQVLEGTKYHAVAELPEMLQGTANHAVSDGPGDARAHLLGQMFQKIADSIPGGPVKPSEAFLESMQPPAWVDHDCEKPPVPSAYSVTTVQPKCRHCGSLIGQAELDKNECNTCHGQFVDLVVDTEPEPPVKCGHCGRNMTSQGPGLVCLPCYSDQDLQASTRIYDRWLDTAHRYAAAHKKVPVVLDVEIYEYYDKPVKITSVNVYPGHTEVTVEGRFGDVAETDLDDLSLRALKFKHAETLVPCCHIRVSEDKQEIDPAFRFAASLSLNRGNRYTCGRSAEEVVQQLKRRYPETADLPVVNDE